MTMTYVLKGGVASLIEAYVVVCFCMAESEREPVVAATFKILVLGDSNVGKSSLIKSYFNGAQLKNLLPTIGETLYLASCIHIRLCAIALHCPQVSISLT